MQRRSLPAELPRLQSVRWLATAWVLAAASYGSALVSVARHHELDSGSQSHTRSGIFRLLPYESTARNIVGRRDRYWAGHFLRFVDPFPSVAALHLDLHAGRPTAEVLIAHWRPLNKIRLWVDTAAPVATLEVRDGARRTTFAVGADHAPATRGPLGIPVDLETSPSWRRHRYWWHSETLYKTHSLRLRLLAPGGDPATARLRYFGDPELFEERLSYQRLGEEVPERAAAGTASRVSFALRNTSSLPWEREDVIPVGTGYRLYDAGDRLLFESRRIPLPHRVGPHAEVEVAFEVAWPEDPGTYHLEADLVLEHVAWFAEGLGEPVLRRQVEVTPEGVDRSAR